MSANQRRSVWRPFRLTYETRIPPIADVEVDLAIIGSGSGAGVHLAKYDVRLLVAGYVAGPDRKPDTTAKVNAPIKREQSVLVRYRCIYRKLDSCILTVG